MAGVVTAVAFATASPIQVAAQAPVQDSLGVQIVATNGQQARARSQLTVADQPEVRIGSVSGDSDYLFSRITGVALLPGERILVVDAEAAELRYFDRQGQFLTRIGRSGQGPGEFQMPSLVNAIAADSVVIYDAMARRFTVVAGGAEGFRTMPGAAAGPGVPMATSGRQVVMRTAGGLPPRGAEGPVSFDMLLRLVDLTEETSQTIVTTQFTQVAVPLGPIPTFVRTPFTFETAVAASRDGFFMAAPTEPGVLNYSWTGELRRIFRLAEPVRTLSAAELSSAIDGVVDEFIGGRDVPRATVREAFGDLEPPAAVPTFRSLILDDLGWLWAETYEEFPTGAATWLLFDPEGRGRGSVLMPEGLTVHSIQGDLVAGVWRDALEVEYVSLHRIGGRP